MQSSTKNPKPQLTRHRRSIYPPSIRFTAQSKPAITANTPDPAAIRAEGGRKRACSWVRWVDGYLAVEGRMDGDEEVQEPSRLGAAGATTGSDRGSPRVASAQQGRNPRSCSRGQKNAGTRRLLWARSVSQPITGSGRRGSLHFPLTGGRASGPIVGLETYFPFVSVYILSGRGLAAFIWS